MAAVAEELSAWLVAPKVEPLVADYGALAQEFNAMFEAGNREEQRRKELDRDVTLEAFVFGAINNAHSPAAYFLVDLVRGSKRPLNVRT